MANDTVYSLDLNGGQTWQCDHIICSGQGGQSSFWRRNDMPQNLVPVGWKVHVTQDIPFFYKCPICYQRDLEDIGVEAHPEYIERHEPNPGTGGTELGGGGKGKRKRRRKRKTRKKKTKKKRKKRRRKKRTKRRK